MSWTVDIVRPAAGARLRHCAYARWTRPPTGRLGGGVAFLDHSGTPSALNSEGIGTMEHGHERQPTIQFETQATGTESTVRVGAGHSEPTPGSELLARERRQLRSELDAANAEVDETRADAIRLQKERDDALRDADDVRLHVAPEVAAARDAEIQVQGQLDEALRMVDDGRDQASEEQWRLIEELDALHLELAACRQELATCQQELAETRQTGRHPSGG
jgi:uncharacterized membrane protein